MIVKKRKIRAKKVTGEQIVEAARKYIGVKYEHQGSEPGKLDCGGLMLLVTKDLGVCHLDIKGYSPKPNGESFERVLSENLIEIVPKENIQLGDILAHDYGDGIQHTSFVSQVSPYIRVIHAKRKYGVVEQRLFGTEDARGWVKTYRIKTVKK